MRLFLHIGVHKTGSTSLQIRFFEHAALIRKEGFLYPLGRLPPPAFQHSGIADLLCPERREELAALLRNIRAEAEAARCHTVILSGENLCLLSEDQIGRLRDAIIREGFVPIVVVFFRRYLDFVRSLISESMKARGHYVTPAQLVRGLGLYDQREITRRFALAFGSGGLIRHDLAGDEDSIVLFDRDIGLTADLPSSRLNVRMDFATLSWLNAIKAELDVPIGVVHRLYAQSFDAPLPLLKGEAAFISEVAMALAGSDRKTLKSQLLNAPGGEALRSIEERIDHLRRFNKFIARLRRYLRRRALRDAARRRFRRIFPAATHRPHDQ